MSAAGHYSPAWPAWTSVSAGGTTPAPPGPAAACGAGATTTCGDLGIGNNYPQNLPRQVTTPAVGGWTSVTAAPSTPAPSAPAAPCGAGASTAPASSGSAATTTRTCPQQVTTPAPAAGPASPAARPHLRHPHRRHPVVLGLQRQRPARHRQPAPARTCPGRSPPRRRRLDQRHRRLRRTPAPSAPAAPCGAGATTLRRARHRQLHRAEPTAASHHPQSARVGQRLHQRRRATLAPPAPASPCGAGAVNSPASSASAATLTRTGRGRSPAARSRQHSHHPLAPPRRALARTRPSPRQDPCAAQQGRRHPAPGRQSSRAEQPASRQVSAAGLERPAVATPPAIGWPHVPARPSDSVCPVPGQGTVLALTRFRCPCPVRSAVSSARSPGGHRPARPASARRADRPG